MWNLMGGRTHQFVRLPRVPVLTFDNLKGMAFHNIVTYLKQILIITSDMYIFFPLPPSGNDIR